MSETEGVVEPANDEQYVEPIVEEKSPEELEQEYKEKAEQLESRLDRLEGRTNKEEMLAAWFAAQDSSVTVRPILKKGMGMASTRPIDTDTLLMVCPPYVCVPYEPRKRFVCAYCFKEYKYLEQRYKDSLEATEGADSTQNADAPQTANVDPEPSGTESLDASLAQLTVDTSVVGAGGDKPEPVAPEVPPMPESIIDELLQCQGCKEVWYCNEECRLADLPEHGHYECRALAKFDVPWAKSYYSYCDDLVTDIRLILRAINKRYWQLSQGINEFEEEYQLLISNMSCYSEDVLTSLHSICQYANYLLPDEVIISNEELLEIYCKHRVNMFGLWANGGECLGYGVYPRASYFNHSCWPNTTFYKNPDLKAPHMNFLTVWPIQSEGEEVCISYIDISVGLSSRRGTLLDKYFFHCTCERCMLQELSPEEPDPYYIYWAPAPPPDGVDPASVPPPSDSGAPPTNGENAHTPEPTSDTPVAIPPPEETPFEVPAEQ